MSLSGKTKIDEKEYKYHRDGRNMIEVKGERKKLKDGQKAVQGKTWRNGRQTKRNINKINMGEIRVKEKEKERN